MSETADTPNPAQAPLSEREEKLLRRAIWALKYCKLRTGQCVFFKDEKGDRMMGFEQYMIEALEPYGVSVDMPELLKQKYGKRKGSAP